MRTAFVVLVLAGSVSAQDPRLTPEQRDALRGAIRERFFPGREEVQPGSPEIRRRVDVREVEREVPVPFPVDRPVFVDRPVDRPVFIDRPVDRPVPFPVDRPVPFPVFLRERTTWVPQTTWEQVEAPQFQRPVPPIYSFEKPRRDIDVRTGLFGHVR